MAPIWDVHGSSGRRLPHLLVQVVPTIFRSGRLLSSSALPRSHAHGLYPWLATLDKEHPPSRPSPRTAMPCCRRATGAATDRHRSRQRSAATCLCARSGGPGERSVGQGAGAGQRSEGRPGGRPGAVRAGVYGARLVSFSGVQLMRRNTPKLRQHRHPPIAAAARSKQRRIEQEAAGEPCLSPSASGAQIV
jgi:hypothetical protein